MPVANPAYQCARAGQGFAPDGAGYWRRSSADSKDKIAVAIMEWHEAWADLAVDVRSAYRDGRQPRAKHVRELLFGAYDSQVERLREEDRKRRTRKESDDQAEDDDD